MPLQYKEKYAAWQEKGCGSTSLKHCTKDFPPGICPEIFFKSAFFCFLRSIPLKQIDQKIRLDENLIIVAFDVVKCVMMADEPADPPDVLLFEAVLFKEPPGRLRTEFFLQFPGLMAVFLHGGADSDIVDVCHCFDDVFRVFVDSLRFSDKDSERVYFEKMLDLIVLLILHF